MKIKLTQGRYALVDDTDFEWLNQWKWHYNCGYAVRTEKDKSKTRMHRIIASTPNGMDTDHINGNPLDNRRSNLKICTHLDNMQNQKISMRNSSGVKGVYKHSQSGKWWARKMVNGRRVSLGLFTDLASASAAYQEATSG